MKTGCHTCDITPSVGMERPGNYGKRLIESIHDPLKVRTAVFDNGETRAAIVGVDTCTLSARLVAEARRRIEQRCGIPAGNVMIAASHTHSGGPLFGFLASDFADAPKDVRKLGVEQSIIVNPVYQECVTAQIVTAVALADQKKRNVGVSFECGRAPNVAFNRRFKMKNGRVYTHPGKGNPDIVAPAGPVDDEVSVLGLWDAERKLLGCVVNFACHATTWGGGVSADWIYFLEQTIQGVFGREAVVVFLSGAAGDVTQVDNQSQRESEFGEHWSRVVGASVGAEAVRLLSCARPKPEEALNVRSKSFDAPRRLPSRERLAQARKVVECGAPATLSNEWSSVSNATAFAFSKELVVLEHIAQQSPTVTVEVQALQIGPALWITNGAEFFAESGLAIKHGSPFPKTQVVTLANGALGYVPPASAFAPGGGGYETVLTSYSNLQIDTAETIVRESLKLAAAFTPPPPVETKLISGKPWDYGVLGPDLD